MSPLVWWCLVSAVSCPSSPGSFVGLPLVALATFLFGYSGIATLQVSCALTPPWGRRSFFFPFCVAHRRATARTTTMLSHERADKKKRQTQRGTLLPTTWKAFCNANIKWNNPLWTCTLTESRTCWDTNRKLNISTCRKLRKTSWLSFS